jgi:hypothetical protein
MKQRRPSIFAIRSHAWAERRGRVTDRPIPFWGRVTLPARAKQVSTVSMGSARSSRPYR